MLKNVERSVVGTRASVSGDTARRTPARRGAGGYVTMPPWAPVKITHVILDLDGTLINTEQLVDEVVGAVLRKHDASLDTKSIRNAIEGVRGMRPLDGSRIIIENLKLRKDGAADGPALTAEELLAETEVELNGRWGEVNTMPGAERLLALLRRHEVPTALATSTPAKYLSAKLASHPNLLEHVACVCTGDECAGSPIHPSSSSPPSAWASTTRRACLVVEDTPLGCQAAKAADARPRRAVHTEPRPVRRPRGRVVSIALRRRPRALGFARV